MKKAIVLQSISGISTIKDINTNDILLAELKGKLLQNKINTYPGDYIEYINNESINIIDNILERKNYLNKPKIANIDYIVIVQSFKEPDLNMRMINKYILYFQSQNINNIILFFTKFDILNSDEKKEANKIMDHFIKDGFQCFYSIGMKLFLDFINNKFKKIICFTGQSGVGKSTLLNKIDIKYNIKTNEISKALNRGKHTTTATHLLDYNDSYLVDTPGFSSVNIDLSESEIAIGYSDFRMYSIKCKYNNCLHKTEDNCEVKKKVEENIISKKRYEDYLYFLDSLK